MTSKGPGESDNPIAEKRRQRKLENQRLEAAARQRQDDLRLQKERELQRQEDERIAVEQRRLDEIETLKRQREAEFERIANIERAEKNRVLAIERQLARIGAFCTHEVMLSSLPQCCAVLSPSSLEQPIDGVDEPLAVVADASCHIGVYRLSDGRSLFRIRIDYETTSISEEMIPITSMCTTRSGHLIVCNQQLGIIGGYDIHQLLMLYAASMTFARDDIPVVKASTALVAAYAFPATPASRIRAVCVDDTANEMFVSDQQRHCVHVLTINPSSSQREASHGSSHHLKAKPPISLTRTFGAKGHGRGQLHRPAGLDVSHYHVLVCDQGNHRIAAYTKRGVFVCAFGSKGNQQGQFLDPRDVKLANVRKRALTRGLELDENSISNEQFEMIVADLGDFRVQILTETGEFLRVLSLLSGGDQIQFHHDFLAARHSALLQLYALIGWPLPSLAGTDLGELFRLAERLHPSCSTYQKIAENVHAIREDAARFHHPLTVAYVLKNREIVVLDRQHCKLFVYSFDGSQSLWTNLPRSLPDPPKDGSPRGLSSVHTTLVVHDRMYVSDPLSHRIAVLQYPSLAFVRYIGATTHGDQTLCAEGYDRGGLRSPTYLSTYYDQAQLRLLVADSGNHCVSIFDLQSGECCGRIGLGFGHLDGYLDSPQGLAVYEKRWLFVCDHRNHRIQVFDLVTKAFSRSVGKEQGTQPGAFSFPLSVAVCSALPRVDHCAFGPFRDAKYCVGDAGNHRVQVLTMHDDSVLWSIDASHTPFELPMVPSTVVFHDTSSYVLIADTANRSVAMFRHDGSFFAAFGSNLEPENCFQRPTSVQLITGGERECAVVTDAVRFAICTFEWQSN